MLLLLFLLHDATDYRVCTLTTIGHKAGRHLPVGLCVCAAARLVVGAFSAAQVHKVHLHRLNGNMLCALMNRVVALANATRKEYRSSAQRALWKRRLIAVGRRCCEESLHVICFLSVNAHVTNCHLLLVQLKCLAETWEAQKHTAVSTLHTEHHQKIIRWENTATMQFMF